MTAVPSIEPSPRVLDHGGPLFLPASEADGRGWALLTSACDNPDCECDRLYIEARPLDRLDAPGPAHEDQKGPTFTFDPARRTVEADPGTGDSAWMVEPLRSSEWQDRLHRRWRALRAEIRDPRFCPSPNLQIDPSEGMVYFSEVFTEGFDLMVQVGDEIYLGHDAYCLQPGCRCDEASIQLDRLDEQGQCHPVGVVRASVRNLERARLEGGDELMRVWAKARSSWRRNRLADRRRRIRSWAKPPTDHAPSAKKTGRNSPCPCGSGKKFKRCCGAPNARVGARSA